MMLNKNRRKEVNEIMAQHNEQTKLDAYVTAFDEINKLVKNDNVAAVILQEVARDRRAQEIRDERKAARQQNGIAEQPVLEVLSKDEPATQRQLEFLKDLGVVVPVGLTRQAASELIDIGLEKRQAR